MGNQVAGSSHRQNSEHCINSPQWYEAHLEQARNEAGQIIITEPLESLENIRVVEEIVTDHVPSVLNSSNIVPGIPESSTLLPALIPDISEPSIVAPINPGKDQQNLLDGSLSVNKRVVPLNSDSYVDSPSSLIDLNASGFGLDTGNASSITIVKVPQNPNSVSACSFTDFLATDEGSFVTQSSVVTQTCDKPEEQSLLILDYAVQETLPRCPLKSVGPERDKAPENESVLLQNEPNESAVEIPVQISDVNPGVSTAAVLESTLQVTSPSPTLLLNKDLKEKVPKDDAAVGKKGDNLSSVNPVYFLEPTETIYQQHFHIVNKETNTATLQVPLEAGCDEIQTSKITNLSPSPRSVLEYSSNTEDKSIIAEHGVPEVGENVENLKEDLIQIPRDQTVEETVPESLASANNLLNFSHDLNSVCEGAQTKAPDTQNLSPAECDFKHEEDVSENVISVTSSYDNLKEASLVTTPSSDSYSFAPSISDANDSNTLPTSALSLQQNKSNKTQALTDLASKSTEEVLTGNLKVGEIGSSVSGSEEVKAVEVHDNVEDLKENLIKISGHQIVEGTVPEGLVSANNLLNISDCLNSVCEGLQTKSPDTRKLSPAESDFKHEENVSENVVSVTSSHDDLKEASVVKILSSNSYSLPPSISDASDSNGLPTPALSLQQNESNKTQALTNLAFKSTEEVLTDNLKVPEIDSSVSGSEEVKTVEVGENVEDLKEDFIKISRHQTIEGTVPESLVSANSLLNISGGLNSVCEGSQTKPPDTQNLSPAESDSNIEGNVSENVVSVTSSHDNLKEASVVTILSSNSYSFSPSIIDANDSNGLPTPALGLQQSDNTQASTDLASNSTEVLIDNLKVADIDSSVSGSEVSVTKAKELSTPLEQSTDLHVLQENAISCSKTLDFTSVHDTPAIGISLQSSMPEVPEIPVDYPLDQSTKEKTEDQAKACMDELEQIQHLSASGEASQLCLPEPLSEDKPDTKCASEVVVSSLSTTEQSDLNHLPAVCVAQEPKIPGPVAEPPCGSPSSFAIFSPLSEVPPATMETSPRSCPNSTYAYNFDENINPFETHCKLVPTDCVDNATLSTVSERDVDNEQFAVPKAVPQKRKKKGTPPMQDPDITHESSATYHQQDGDFLTSPSGPETFLVDEDIAKFGSDELLKDEDPAFLQKHSKGNRRRVDKVSTCAKSTEVAVTQESSSSQVKMTESFEAVVREVENISTRSIEGSLPNQSEAGPDVAQFTEEEFSNAAQFFKDPAAFEFLQKASNSKALQNSSLARLSLYVKFDPLLKNGSPLTCSSGSGCSNKIERSRQTESELSHPEHPGPSNSSMEEQESVLIDFSTTYGRRLSQGANERTRDVHLEPDLVSSHCQEQKMFTEEEVNQALQMQELLYQEKVLKKDKALSEVQKAWDRDKVKMGSQITTLREAVRAERMVVKEMARLMDRCMQEKESQRIEMTESNQKLIKERDQALEDLQNVESAFGDLHRRYEKAKAALESYKQHQEELKQALEDSNHRLHKQEEMYNLLRSRTEEKLDSANVEIESARKSGEAELAVLKAQLKKAEMRISSLEKGLEQKINENAELSNICDELIAKVGKV